jgi:SAM-dependent methyltransferase
VTGASEWTGAVGDAWAQEWRRTDRSFGALTDRLLAPAAIAPFAHALDIGCGAGELVERLASTHPAAKVTGVDISEELVAVARARCAWFTNAQLIRADAANWVAAPGAAPDLLVSRHGVMFFADPTQAFAHLRAQAAPGALLRFSCFRARRDNGWAVALASALPPQPEPDPGAPGPFAFADPARVEAILAAAGWRAIAFDAVDYAMVVGEGPRAAVEALSYFQRIGPAARALRELPEADRAPTLDRLATVIEAHHSAGQVALPAASWIVTARA